MRPRPSPWRSLGALVGLVVGLAAADVLAGPTRPDAAEGPRSMARTLGSYAVHPRQALGRLDLPTLAGLAPGDGEAAAADKVQRLAAGLMAEADSFTADRAPDTIAELSEIVVAASSRPGRRAGARDLLDTVVNVQQGPGAATAAATDAHSVDGGPDGSRRPIAATIDASVSLAEGPSSMLGPTIEPGGYATEAITGPGGFLAVLSSLPNTLDVAQAGAPSPARTAAPRPAEGLPSDAGEIERTSSLPAYAAAASIFAAVLVLLLILTLQSRRGRRSH